MWLGSLRERVPAPLRDVVGTLREHRAPVLAASVAFYGLLSIPPLLVAFIATAAIVAIAMGPDVVHRLNDQIMSIAGQALSPEAIADVVRPSVTKVLEEPSPGVLSLGYLLALWSASRMINALIQGVEILTGTDDERSNLRTRLLAIKTLVIGLLAVTILLPILAIGPSSLLSFLGASLVVTVLGWLLSTALLVFALMLFFRAAIPHKPVWGAAAVGSVVTVTGWGLGSLLLQEWAARATSGPSIYGPLSAPIALLLWLQLMALMALAGAAVIHAIDPDHARGTDQGRPAP